jgi:hypothetical protein
MSPITCFSFDETRWYTATDEADLCPVTAIICAIEQFLPRIVAPVARMENIHPNLLNRCRSSKNGG